MLIEITILEGFMLRLPTFMFLTAFSQITSRICHPLEECFKTLTDIIVKCILDYPNHSLWMLMTLHKVLIIDILLEFIFLILQNIYLCIYKLYFSHHLL